MSAPQSPGFKNIPIVSMEAANHRFLRWRPVLVESRMMPYAAAAKAIYVKANGLRAYEKAMGSPGDEPA